MQIELPIQEIDEKYKKLTPNTFSTHLQHFYQTVYEAGQQDFQAQQSATHKLKRIIDQLIKTSNNNNQYSKDAFISISQLVCTLLLSNRWQDNNAGLKIVITFIQAGDYLFIDNICDIFNKNFTIYLQQNEQIIIENTLELFVILLNKNQILDLKSYQQQIENLMSNLLIDIPNSQGYLQQLRNQNELLIHDQNDLDVGYDSKFTSKYQIYPFLQLLNYLLPKTQDFRCINIIQKCVMVNQKRARLQAIILLNTFEEQLTFSDTLQLLEICLYDIFVDIRKQATELAKKRIIKLNQEEKQIYIQRIGCFLLMNKQLTFIQNETKELEVLLNIKEQETIQIIEANFFLMVNISVTYLSNSDFNARKQAWHTLCMIMGQSQFVQIYENILDKAIVALAVETKDVVIYYCLQHIKKILQQYPKVITIKGSQLFQCLQNIQNQRGIPHQIIIDIIKYNLANENQRSLDILNNALIYLQNHKENLDISKQCIRILLMNQFDIDLQQMDQKYLESLIDQDLVKNYPVLQKQ